MNRRQKILYDIECYYNCFLFSIKDYDTKETTVWEISDTVCDFEKIKDFFLNFRGFLVSFNGEHYDSPVTMWLIHNYHKSNRLQALYYVKQWSDRVISDDMWWRDKSLQKYKYPNLGFKSIDLFLYWSRGLRMSKKISLKGLAIQLNYPVIQELPYPPDKMLTADEIDELAHYSSVHDLGILELLLLQFEGKGTIPLGNLGTIALRGSVKKKYRLNCLSWDAPKLASEVMLVEYASKTNQSLKDVKQLRFEKESFQFKDLFKNQKFNFTTPLFKDVYDEWMNSYNTFEKQFVAFTENQEVGHKISIGVGGIHSIVKNKIFETEEDYDIWDIDIESLYPTFILNLHCFRFKEIEDSYAEFKRLRVTESKPNVRKYKGTPTEQFWKDEDAFYKVILNGLSGHIDQEYSPLYNNIGDMKMRCMGQLVLLVMTERILQNNIEVLQINTDGITVKIHKNKQEWFRKAVIDVEKEFNVKFEYGFYSKMVLQHVNSYLAIDTDGKIKQKGEFVENPELGNAVNFLVIAKAINAYYVNGTNPEEFIMNHKEIYDFCASKKVDRTYTVMWTSPDGAKSVQQRLNRFYVSTKGGYIMKCRYGSEHHLLKDSGVQLYNNYSEEFPTDINYQYYINKVKNVILELTNRNQLELF